MIRDFIFDWSGTLVDDLEMVLAATNHALVAEGQEAMSRERFRAEFRLPVQAFYDRVFPGLSQEKLQAAFHRHFAEVHARVTVLPHAREFLEFVRVRGGRMFLLTTVPEPYLRTQLAGTGLGGFFQECVAGARDKREKIGELLVAAGLVPEETLLVGDMEHDIEAAHHGRVRSCAVLTGYQTPEDLRRARPDLLVEHLGELQRLLEQGDMELGDGGGGGRRRPVGTVGALIRDGQGRCLMVRTRKWSDRWGIPGGKIEYGETAEAALRREILEETNLELREIRFVMVQDCIESPEFYRSEHFLLLNYVGRCAEPAEVQLNAEAQAYQWVREEEALRLPLNAPTRRLIEAVREAEKPA